MPPATEPRTAAPAAERVAVLMYHRVGAIAHRAERDYCIAPRDFAAHMRRLRALGRRACSLAEFLAWRRGEAALPEGAFLITFDDGFRDVLEHAAPALAELGWPAAMFAVSGCLGTSDGWNRDAHPEGRTYALLDGAQLRELAASGFAIGSHSRHHRDLTALDEAALTDQVRGSRRELEDLLGQPVTAFAYPYGRFDARVADAVREAGYESAFSSRSGFNRPGADPFAIRRIDVFGTDSTSALGRKVTLGSNDGSLRAAIAYYVRRAVGGAAG